MRISFLQSSLWLSGGGRVVVEHCNRLAARGHQVCTVIPRDTISPELGSVLSSQVQVCQAAYPLTRPVGLWGKMCLTLAMAAAVPASDVIVATHTPTTLVSLLAGRIARRGTPVWFYMDYPGMFENRPQEAWLLRRALAWHRGAVVLSQHSADELLSFSRGDVRYIGIGLSIYDLLAARARLVSPGKQKRILYLGDFRPRKGLTDFLEAARRVYQSIPDIELTVVVKEDGPIQTPVPYLKIVRPGDEALADCYAGHDLFVSASWFEGFGLPPLEAMACGTPVVMTDSGGVRDYARPGENCLLVPAKNPSALAQAMIQALTQPDLAVTLSRNGPPTAAEFTWEKASQRMETALVDFTR